MKFFFFCEVPNYSLDLNVRQSVSLTKKNSKKIEDFTKFIETKESKESPIPCIVRNLLWTIAVQSKQTDKGELELVSSLDCNCQNESTDWSVRAVVEFRLVNQTDPEKSYIKKTEHLFCSEENSRGLIITMKDILDNKKGLFCRRSSSLPFSACQKF
jgi:hypothetical protein